MKSQASFTILMDRLERFSVVLLRLLLGAAFIAAAMTGGAMNFPPAAQLPAAVVWLVKAAEIMAGIALIIGFRIRLVALTCGALLLLLALSVMKSVGSLPGMLVLVAAVSAFVLATRDSHPWSLDYFFSGDWLPVFRLHGQGKS